MQKNKIISFLIFLTMAVITACSSSPNIKTSAAPVKVWTHQGQWLAVDKLNAGTAVAVGKEKDAGMFSSFELFYFDTKSGKIEKKVNSTDKGQLLVYLENMKLEIYKVESKVIARNTDTGAELYTIDFDGILDPGSSFRSSPATTFTGRGMIRFNPEKNILIIYDQAITKMGTSKITGYNLKTGVKLWSGDIPESSYSRDLYLNKEYALLLSTEYAFVGKSKLHVRTIEYSSGKMNTMLSTLTLDITPGRSPVFIFFGPYYEGQRMYIGSKGVACFDLKEGKELWSKEFETQKGSGLLTFVNAMSVVGGVGSLAAVVAGGNISLGSCPVNPVFIPDDRMIVYDIEGTVYCLDRSTGKELWVNKIDKRFMNLEVKNDEVLIEMGAYSVTLEGIEGEGPFGYYVLDLATGKEKWKYLIDNDNIKGISRNNNLLIFADKENIYKIDTAAKKAEVVKFVQVNKTDSIKSIEKIEGTNDLFIFTGEKTIRYDLASDTIKYAIDLGMEFQNMSFVKFKDKIIFNLSTEDNAYLYLVEPQTGTVDYFHNIMEFNNSMFGNSFVLIPEANRYLLLNKDDNKKPASFPKATEVTGYTIIPE